MSTGGLILGLAFLVGVVGFLAWPLLTGRQAAPDAPINPGAARLNELRAEREAILIAVRDLDFDHQMSKYAEDDYQTQRETLMRRGVEVLKQIDSLESDSIEAAVRARRSA
jgi:hypothetical protein